MDFKKLAKYFTAKEFISGISISDSGVKLCIFSPDNSGKILAKMEADLPKGAIIEGELKQPEILLSILEGFRHAPELVQFRQIYSILSLPSATVYHKVFDLPNVKFEEVEGAADLNVKMLSPIKFEDSYSDWEILEEGNLAGRSFRIASVFGKKAIIDSYNEILNKAGFSPLAVEFSALSLWRFFSGRGFLEEGKICLIVNLNSDGLDFLVVKNRGLQFNYFQSWQGVVKTSSGLSESAKSGNITQEDFFKIFTEELRKVNNFYFSRFQETITCSYLISPAYQSDLEKIINEQFNIPLLNDRLPTSEFSPGFYQVLGAADRGLIPRESDLGLSLMAVGTEDEYRRKRSLNFLDLWIKVLASSSAVLLAVVLGSFLFFNSAEKNASQELANLNLKVDPIRFKELEEKALKFNDLARQVLVAKNSVSDWSKFFNIWKDSSAEIGIAKILVDPNGFSSFRGWANTESKMFAFKEKMTSLPESFSQVEIPLSSVIRQKNGVEFNLNFKLIKLP